MESAKYAIIDTVWNSELQLLDVTVRNPLGQEIYDTLVTCRGKLYLSGHLWQSDTASNLFCAPIYNIQLLLFAYLRLSYGQPETEFIRHAQLASLETYMAQRDIVLWWHENAILWNSIADLHIPGTPARGYQLMRIATSLGKHITLPSSANFEWNEYKEDETATLLDFGEDCDGLTLYLSRVETKELFALRMKWTMVARHFGKPVNTTVQPSESEIDECDESETDSSETDSSETDSSEIDSSAQEDAEI